MKKIRGDFLTEKDAASAMEKINAHCGNIKILYDGYESDYNNFMPADYNLNESLFDFPETVSFNFGMFGIGSPGIAANRNLSPYISENRYARGFFGLGQNYSGRAVLEADVADDNFEYVKDELYSHGAISVV